MNKCCLCSLALLSALSLSTSARADTVDTFKLNDVTLTGGTATGTVDIDTTNGTITSEDITVTIGIDSYTFDDPGVDLAGFFVYADTFTDPGGDTLTLIIPNPIKGYDGGPLCTTADECSTIAGKVTGDFNPAGFRTPANDLTGGSLVPNTPEPSSLVLLGTGVLGVAGAVRRRLLKA